MKQNDNGDSTEPHDPRMLIAVDVQSAAELISMSATSIWKYIGTGDLESSRIGRKRVILFDSLLAFVKRNKVTIH